MVCSVSSAVTDLLSPITLMIYCSHGGGNMRPVDWLYPAHLSLLFVFLVYKPNLRRFLYVAEGLNVAHTHLWTRAGRLAGGC